MAILGSFMCLNCVSILVVPYHWPTPITYFFFHILQRNCLQSLALCKLLSVQEEIRQYFLIQNSKYVFMNVGIQVVYHFVFGLYISYIFTKSQALISSLVLQVYANFMGYPQYFEILKGNLYNDRIRSNDLSFRNYYFLFIWSHQLSLLLFALMIVLTASINAFQKLIVPNQP